MGRTPIELRRDLGAAARLWSAPAHHTVEPEWWTAFSGELSVYYNVACCQSSDNDVLVDHCLQPLLDLKKPGIIMLAGPGLATAQKLADAGWVVVEALPLMVLDGPDLPDVDGAGVRALTEEDLPEARALLADTYSTSDAAAAAAVPLLAVEDPDLGVWGLFDGDRMVSSFTGATEDGLVVVWSMATRPHDQGNGYGRRLLATALRSRFEAGAEGSLLQSSEAGERLYRGLGYEVVEYWQLWSRPRWVMARA
jgi:ribosomal protein S18 acetylase RimI-like enzyme